MNANFTRTWLRLETFTDANDIGRRPDRLVIGCSHFLIPNPTTLLAKVPWNNRSFLPDTLDSLNSLLGKLAGLGTCDALHPLSMRCAPSSPRHGPVLSRMRRSNCTGRARRL